MASPGNRHNPPASPAPAIPRRRSLELSLIELKVLLTLVGWDQGRAKLSEIALTPKVSTAALKKTLNSLREKGLVDYHDTIKKFASTPTSRILVELDLSRSTLPVTPDELYVLKVCRREPKTPDDLKTIPPGDRQAVLRRLGGRDLIKLTQVQITEVWLTVKAVSFLRDDYAPPGDSADTIGLPLLANYLLLLRQGRSPHPPRR